MSDLRGIAAVMLALGGLFVGLRLASKRFAIHPEITRKALHVGMGLICMTFPWLFGDAAPAIVLGVGAGLALLGLRLLPIARASLGPVLHGVERASLGEFYFIAGVLTLFLVTHGDARLYVLPLVWLTFADATAALIGVRYGTVRYATHDGRKSIEGSCAFFVVTYIATFMGLVALGRVNVIADALISAIVGVLAMLLEAVAWDGIDNFVIPVFGFVLFQTLVHGNVLDLIVRAAVLAASVAATLWQRRRTTLGDDALMGAVLCTYAFWVLGGWIWVVPPAILFFKDKLQAKRESEPRRHDIQAMMAICTPGLLCALGNRLVPTLDWFLPFALAFAVQLALFEQTLLTNARPRTPALVIEFVATLVGCVPMFLTYTLVRTVAHENVLPHALAGGALTVLLACELFRHTQPRLDDCPRDAARWFRQAGLSTLGAGAALAFAGGL